MNRLQAIDLLGLGGTKPSEISPDVLTAAFRKRAFETHPDHGGDADQFALVRTAYNFLRKNGTMSTGLYVGGVPVDEVRDDLRNFARDLFRSNRQGKKYVRSVPKETVLSGDLIKVLELHGAWTFNVHGHVFQKRGVPDLYVAHPFWTGWLELKVEDREVKELQRIQMEKLLGNGVPAFVLRLRRGDGDWGEPGLVAQYETQVEIHHLAVLPMDVWCLTDSVGKAKAVFRFLQEATRELSIRRHGRRVGIWDKTGKSGVDVYG
jgi:hypothetical protein